MTGAPGFLEFFILEASDYVEQLDGFLLGGGTSGPDASALQRVARALRGSATMAKLPPFAELAASVERVGRAMQEGVLQWDPVVGGALVAAIDDLKTLLHSARTLSPADEQRAAARAAELAKFAPPRPTQPSGMPATASGASFLATEAANIAAGLELLTARPDKETAANVLNRVRALRGVAGVKEVGPLADALEATEDAARPLETHGHTELTSEARRLLDAAASYLRAMSSSLKEDGSVSVPQTISDAFTAAQDAWGAREDDRERVIPIADLFFPDGGVVETASNPPTSAQERFRLELTSLGEHLREVVQRARAASDPSAKARARRELRRALSALQSTATSFGEQSVADFVASHWSSTQNLDFLELASLDDLARVLTHPGARGEGLHTRLADIAGGRELSSAIGSGFDESTPALIPELPSISTFEPAPEASQAALLQDASEPEPGEPAKAALPVVPEVEVLDNASAALIDSTIAALESMTATPMFEPNPIPEDVVVPIETLVYRGQAALARAIEIRDTLRRSGPTSDPVALDELFDLLELARAE